MRRACHPVTVALLSVLVCAALAGAPADVEKAPPPEHLAPIILEPDDAGGPKPAPAEKLEAKPAEVLPLIRVDVEARSVRIPVRFSRAEGTVEWFLSAGKTHQRMSVLVTDQPAKVVAAALAKAGLPTGKPPAPLAEDRVRPPTGTTVELEVVVAHPDGTETRYPANLFLATSPEGDPVENGRWVYVGPPIVREGEATLLVTSLSGSLVTTNLRDTSALVYWVPSDAEDFVRSFYLSGVPLPEEGFACELEIRAAKVGPETSSTEAAPPTPETPPAKEPNGETDLKPSTAGPTEGL